MSTLNDKLDGEQEPRRFGRHRVVRLIGRGAMGSVYEAIHEDLQKRVAVKTLREGTDSPEIRARFVREGRAASRVRHPNAIDVYDVAVEGDVAYLVMEFLEGEDLDHRLQTAVRLSVEETLDVMLPVIAAVATAHDVGVVHRDLKPANIFLAQGPDGPQPKVVDFGISKVFGEEGGLALTASSAILGTPYYLAPEQLEGAKFTDARSDQWALSVILYECLTGRRPFEADSVMSLLWCIGHGEVAPPRSLRPELDPALEAAVLRGLARRPDDRHPSVRALGAALLPFASAEAQARWSRALGGPGPAREPRASAVALGDTLPGSFPGSDPGRVGTPSLAESVREVPPAESPSYVPPPRPRRRGALVAGAALALVAAGALGVSLRAEPGARPAPLHAATPSVTRLATPPPPEQPPPPPMPAAPPTSEPAVGASDAGRSAVAQDVSAATTPRVAHRRHRSRPARAEGDAPSSVVTSMNGAPVLGVIPEH